MWEYHYCCVNTVKRIQICFDPFCFTGKTKPSFVWYCYILATDADQEVSMETQCHKILNPNTKDHCSPPVSKNWSTFSFKEQFDNIKRHMWLCCNYGNNSILLRATSTVEGKKATQVLFYILIKDALRHFISSCQPRRSHVTETSQLKLSGDNCTKWLRQPVWSLIDAEVVEFSCVLGVNCVQQLHIFTQ